MGPEPFFPFDFNCKGNSEAVKGISVTELLDGFFSMFYRSFTEISWAPPTPNSPMEVQ
jgi:hypothetical protein